MNGKRIFKRSVALICIVIIFVYAFALLLPHSHDACTDNCAICTLIKSAATLTAIWVLVSHVKLECEENGSPIDAFHGALILHDRIPVWLKVKLSD